MSARFPFVAFVAAVALMGAGTVARAAELKVGDKAPDFTLSASDGKTYKLADFKGKKAVVLAWFPKAFTAGLHDRVQVAGRQRRQDPPVRRRLLHGERRCRRRREGQQGVRRVGEGRLPAAERPHQGNGDGLRRPASERGFAQRWTFYIDKDGKIAAIDKAVKPPTSAEDMIAKLDGAEGREGPLTL